MRRYFMDSKIAGRFYGTAQAAAAIYKAAESNKINYVTQILKEGDRLDIIAGRFYKNSTYWWIISAASGIGWGLQVPPGTVIRIPTDLTDIKVLVG